MNLGLSDPPASYRGPTQTARVQTERWVREQVYCPNCGEPSLEKYANNKPVADFFCLKCKEDFELKGQKGKFGPRVVDGAFGTMCQRLAADDNPNLFLLNYSLAAQAVADFFIVPRQFFIREIIQERKPLKPPARRAGWIGCNILLRDVPESGKIYFVRDGRELPKHRVLEQWQKTLFLRHSSADARGWLIEVMKCVERIGRPDFDLDEVYAFESHLSGIYPGNNNVRPKIRQQLQVLRDQGFVEFLGRGHYRLKATG